MKDAAPEVNASSSEAEEEREEQPKLDGDRDPDFSQVIVIMYVTSKQADKKMRLELKVGLCRLDFTKM